MRYKALWLSMVAAGFTLQAHGETHCELHRYAELPVTMMGTRPIVAGSINGEKARFLADSGAFFSVLSRESAARFNLKLDFAPENYWVNGVTDSERPKLTKAKQFSLDGFIGGHVFKDVNFLVMGSLAGNGYDGIIGENALGGADAEYDLGEGFIRLFESKGCRNRSLAYWNHGSAVAEVDIEERTAAQSHLIGTAMLNGKKIRVVFDSGAARSILTLHAAARVGIKPDDESVKAGSASGGIGKRLVDTWIAHFNTLDIGGELIKNARLRIGDIDPGRDADMLLGADFFLSHRIYVASRQSKIYFTYNGGPVFDLRVRNAGADSQTAGTSNDSSVSSTTSSVESSPSMSASEFRLRGVALAGREQFQQAIAELNIAIKLDSNDPENFYQRGLAYWRNRQPELALADFNSVLALKPDHVAALVSRGRLQLESRNNDAARADFAAALNQAPHDHMLLLQIADIYESHRYYEEAIEQFNAWIAANPKDEQLQRVLNQRCFARLMTGKELQLALEDCNAALNQGSGYSNIYTNRGLVLLRLGDVDKAMKDFRKALKLQPKDARSLYGLGLAEKQKGLTTAADRDINLAMLMDPGVGKWFDQFETKK